MLKNYYQQQLDQLRELGREFSRAHPAIAPFVADTSNDPDVRILLQGVAFLTGLLRQKLDDEFPEIIHGLMDVIFPHYLRPLPAASLVQFTPKPGLTESVFVPAGTSLASVPVGGTECLFRTCFDTEVHPLEIRQVELDQKPGRSPFLKLSFHLNGVDLSRWQPTSLRFFPGETFDQSVTLFMLLTRYIKDIELRPHDQGNVYRLPPEALRTVGFERKNSLLPFPTQTFTGFRYLQEYFYLPQKFLFLELHGWEKWRHRGTGADFDIVFNLKEVEFTLPQVNAGKIILFATPVVNLFPCDADPVLYDHRTEKVRIHPAGLGQNHLQVFSVDRVVGFQRGSVTRREYFPIELYTSGEKSDSVYQLIHSLSPTDGTPQLELFFPYRKESEDPATETLSMSLTCTNGTLPDSLKPNDICRQTFDSPEMLIPRSLMSPTASVNPPLGKNTLWKFLSHLSMNFLAVTDRDNLQSLLRLYVYPEGRDKSKITANLRRIEGIMGLVVQQADRMIQGVALRGYKVEMTADRDYFANVGDMILFGSLIDLFLGTYSSMNSFVQFQLKDRLSGETYLWPPRIGGNQRI